MLQRQATLYRYLVPVNEANPGESQTCVVISTFEPRARRRRVHLHKVIKRMFNLTRKETNQAIREMGFDDLCNFA